MCGEGNPELLIETLRDKIERLQEEKDELNTLLRASGYIVESLKNQLEKSRERLMGLKDILRCGECNIDHGSICHSCAIAIRSATEDEE